jgi:uncharacterized LabA/DUF88 family protein
MAERIAVYVDGANAYFAQKEALNWWIDWPSFLEWVQRDKELVSARWYQSYRRTPEPEQERFLHHLTIVGYAVRKKVLKSIYDRESGQNSVKGNLNIELVIDALTDAPHYDTILLVTGDSDFVPLVEALRSRGKRVLVAATQQNVAVDLRQVIGVNYIDLGDLRDEIESDKRPPDRSERFDESSRTSSRAMDYREEEFAAEASEPNGNVRLPEDDYKVTSILDPHPPSAPSQDIVLPQEGEIVRCTVQSVKKYGIFLDLHENVKTLLHVKDMNRGYVADAGQFYRVGQEVPVQVVGIDWERQPPEVRVQVVTPEMEY